MKRGFCTTCIVLECFWPLALKIPYLSSYWEQCNPVAKHHMIEIIHMDLVVAPALYCLVLEQVSRPLTQGLIARANDEWIPASFRYICDFGCGCLVI